MPLESLEDDEHDAKEAVLHRYFLQEWEIVKRILDKIVSDGRATNPSDVENIRKILGKYQEQGQLLEPYLESIASPLMFIVRSRAMELSVTAYEVIESVKPLCSIMYTLITVCGYKSVVKFFPHQVSDLELAVILLEKFHNPMLGQNTSGEMETKCVLLLWLYILILIPFDISSVDTSMASHGNPNGDGSPPLVSRILDFSKFYLSNSGPMRNISGLLLSRLLTRHDMINAFHSFTKWAHEVLSSVTDDIMEHFRLLGVVAALASLFKVGSRKLLLDAVTVIWDDVTILRKSTTAARSPLLRKLLVKLSQRIGLICLPHRPVTWHYVMATRKLDKNIPLNSSGNPIPPDQLNGHGIPLQNSSFFDEEDMDVPEIVEDIIDLLQSGLRDTDTVVRWSAAKGIGRITARLTVSLSHEVLSSILDLFAIGEGDGSWHGGCLALAELARRGLLLPASIEKVVPFLIKALHYDIRRGPHSVGSHVRDAAAYVCWAFGRAYSSSDMKSILEDLAPHLLSVACYDREVNCRRAASAAFQENVGRQGSFLHGIDIVNAADYFSLSSRVHSYLHVAVYIAQFKHYLYPFTEELISYKICHWEKGLRELAGKALSALAKYDKEYFMTCVLDKLIPCTLSSDLCMRHGATLAAGELVLALHFLGYNFPVEKQKTLAGVVPAIEKARLFRGKGGEIMRSAVSRYIECTSISGIILNERLKQRLFDALNENLKHPNAQIQTGAIEALKYFIPAYLDPSKGGTEIISIYLQLLDDPNVAARRGSAMVFGVLPYEFLALQQRVILGKLCSCCTLKHMPDDPDAESRVNAVKGLVSVCETVAVASKGCQFEEAASFYSFLGNEVMLTLFEALDDYSVDSRGDVGSWIREASISGLERLTYILCERDYFISIECEEKHLGDILETEVEVDGQPYPLFNANIATSLIGGIVKQAVEKLDKLREIACKTLQRILYCEKYIIHCIPHRNVLEDIIPKNSNLEWGVPAISYPRLVRLLQFDCYRKYIVSGLVISIGGLQESLRKASITALLDFLKTSETDVDEKHNYVEYSLSTDLLWTLQHYENCDRVVIPSLKTIEILLSKKVFLNMKDQNHDFGSRVMDSLQLELKGSKDFMKLSTGLSILGYYASVINPIKTRAFSSLLSYLGHRYPKIRKAAADQIYLVVLQNPSLVPEEKTETFMDGISQTCWDGDVEEARRVRSQLLEMVGLVGCSAESHKNPSNVGASDIIGGSLRERSLNDENESYSSLVGLVGF